MVSGLVNNIGVLTMTPGQSPQKLSASAGRFALPFGDIISRQ